MNALSAIGTVAELHSGAGERSHAVRHLLERQSRCAALGAGFRRKNALMTDLPALFHLEAVRSAGMSRLLLLDLDNTLADRDRAYSTWAQRKAAQWTLGDRSPVRFLIDEDRDGLRPRRELFEAVRVRFGRSEPADELLGEYRSELLAALPPVEPAIIDRLKELRATGWRVAIVTNGQADVQQAKISHLALTDLLDAWCILRRTRDPQA